MNPRPIWLVLLFAVALPSATADDAPMWEAGIGIGVVGAPDYRGADEGRGYVLPLPYFIYRGERLRVDRRGIRGELLGTARASFELSANLGPPADSDENAAREGMPDLNPTVELGPVLDVLLRESVDGGRRLSLRLPLRAAIATDLEHAEYIGAVFLPHLALDLRNVGPAQGWNLGLSAGPIFATDGYHDYFYAVPPEFARPGRPAYDAPGGYSGVSVGVTISKRFPKHWIGAFVRYDNLHGAVFADSPLVRTHHAVIAGFGISRIVAQSARPAPARRRSFDDP